MNRQGHGRGWWRLAPPLGLGALILTGMGPTPSAEKVGGVRRLVEIRGMAFQPAVLELHQGDTVVWVNRDIFPHTATAEAKPAWSTGTLAQDQTGRFVAGRTGEIRYFCEFHPGMKGILIVR